MSHRGDNECNVNRAMAAVNGHHPGFSGNVEAGHTRSELFSVTDPL